MLGKNIAAFLSIAIASPAAAPAQAPATPPALPMISVVGERDTADMARCGVAYASALASAEAAFRYNRVRTGAEDDYVAGRAIGAYVNLNVFPILYESGRETGTCAAAISLSLRSPASVVDPVTGYRHFAVIEFCKGGSLLSAARADMQARINANLRNYANECVSRYLQTIRGR